MAPLRLLNLVIFTFTAVFIYLTVITTAEDAEFEYDINPGSPRLSVLLGIGREKREVCDLAKGNFTRKEKITLRKAHNSFRRTMTLKGGNMRRLDWKIRIAQRAQAWVNKCYYDHDYLTDCKNNNKRLGQNLYVVWGGTYYPKVNVETVVAAWHSEIQYFNMTENSCSGVCGHYKQVVWANSQYFGCGVAYCPVMKHPGAADKKFAVLVGCDYFPAGNYGQALPYIVGEPCSACQAGTKCQNNLCIPAAG